MTHSHDGPLISLLSLTALGVVSIGLGTQACQLVDNPDYVVVTEPEGNNVLLRVMSTEGEPIEEPVIVTVDGQAAVSDSAGFVQFEGLPDGPFVARIDAKGHTSAVVSAEVSEGVAVFDEVNLFPLDPSPELEFEIGDGADLRKDGVRVVIPPNALVDSEGDPATGTAQATIVHLDPTSEDGLDNLPGPLTATKQAEDGEVILRSLAMVEVSLWQEDRPLQLAEGARSRIEIELPVDAAATLEAGNTDYTAWSLDLDAGTWHEVGAGLIQLDTEGVKIWATTVDHFTWLNCDKATEWPQQECFVVQVDVEDTSLGQRTLLSDVGVGLVDEGTGAYKDKATSLLSEENKGGNCLVFEKGTIPTLTVTAGTSTHTVKIDTIPGHASSIGTGGCYANPTDDDYEKGQHNEACQPLLVQLPASAGFTKTCSAGKTETCGTYSGNSRDLDAADGICKQATHNCIGGLSWSDCGGEVTPQTEENCITVGIDDNCDGRTTDYSMTNAELCDCTTDGASAACYNGPVGTADVGACETGARTCGLVGGRLMWGECNDKQPEAEDCSTLDDKKPAQDENCDTNFQCTAEDKGTLPTNATIYDMAVGPKGEVYALGYFEDELWWNNQQHTIAAAGGQDTLLVKLDRNNQIEWAKTYGDTGNDYGRGLAVTAAGDLVIAGSFTTQFDGKTKPHSGVAQRGIYVAKIDNRDGHALWSQVYAGDNATGDSVGYDVAIDTQGRIFVTGIVYGDDPFNEPAPALAKSNIYLLSLEDKGTKLWSKIYGSGSVERASGIAVGIDDDLFVTGYFYDTLDFVLGEEAKATVGAHDMFVAKFDGDTGATQWAESYGSTKSESANGIAVYGTNVFVTGSFRDTITFGTTTYTVDQSTELVEYAFVAAFAQLDGAVQWSKGYVGNQSGDERGQAITTDNAGYVIFTGYFDGTVDFGGVNAELTTNTTKGIMLVKLKNNGDFVWAKYPEDGTVRALTTTSAGLIYAGGDDIMLRNEP